jgi:hypothetical protein
MKNMAKSIRCSKYDIQMSLLEWQLHCENRKRLFDLTKRFSSIKIGWKLSSLLILNLHREINENKK